MRRFQNKDLQMEFSTMPKLTIHHSLLFGEQHLCTCHGDDANIYETFYKFLMGSYVCVRTIHLSYNQNYEKLLVMYLRIQVPEPIVKMIISRIRPLIVYSVYQHLEKGCYPMPSSIPGWLIGDIYNVQYRYFQWNFVHMTLDLFDKEELHRPYKGGIVFIKGKENGNWCIRHTTFSHRELRKNIRRWERTNNRIFTIYRAI